MVRSKVIAATLPDSTTDATVADILAGRKQRSGLRSLFPLHKKKMYLS